MTTSFQIDIAGSKLQVATFDKWILPSERNRTANINGPFNNGPYINLFLNKIKPFYWVFSGSNKTYGYKAGPIFTFGDQHYEQIEDLGKSPFFQLAYYLVR